MSTIKAVVDFVRSLRSTSRMTTSRYFDSLFANRMVVAVNASTLVDMAEELKKSLDSDHTLISGAKIFAFMDATRAADAHSVLLWIRSHPRIIAMICSLRDDEEYEAALASLSISEGLVDNDSTVAGMEQLRRVCDHEHLG